MMTRFPMIAAAALLSIPAVAHAAEQELDPVRLAELRCQLGGECGEPAGVLAAGDETGDVVVDVRAGNASGRAASPFPDFKTLQAMKKKGGGAAPAMVPAATRPGRDVARVASRDMAAPVVGRRSSVGAAVAAEAAVAKRANLFVTFRLGSAELEPSAIKEISTLAEAIRLNSEAGQLKRVRIAGHTDATGDDEVNTKLSADRAAAVRQALLERGIAAEMLEAEGFGSQQPIDGYAPTHGINRRVEAVVID
ncbi:OmpA family protein [Porphyrobacter sp. AAP60]|uniref:OmpA family protein n=1 Tax=Porphyrobacter sp. AAP60 TaxID=1523423 RepID=UPI0006B92082|nr:OmpA family protein [Porphyrobacter sp. AAP60]